MGNVKQHFLHILLFYYQKCENAGPARKTLSNAYGEVVLTKCQCQNWFAKFRSDNFDVEDATFLKSSWSWWRHHKGINWSKPANNNSWVRWQNQYIQFEFMIIYLNRRSFILNNISDPHVLTESNLCRRLDDPQKNYSFRKRIITGEEKRVFYKNVKRIRSWSKKDEPAQSTTSKADIHQKRDLFSRISKESLFLSFYRNNFEVYGHQLGKFNDALKQK